MSCVFCGLFYSLAVPLFFTCDLQQKAILFSFCFLNSHNHLYGPPSICLVLVSSLTLAPPCFHYFWFRSPPIHPTNKRIKTSAPVHPPAQLLAQQPLQPIHPFHPQVSPFEGIHMPQPQVSPSNPRKRRASPPSTTATNMAPPPMPTTAPGDLAPDHGGGAPEVTPRKKGRTNTPWSAEEEQRLKTMRDAGSSWSEIAKVCLTPNPTD